MARTLQKLINFHGSSKTALDASASSLSLGEIAVMHDATNDDHSLLAIKNNADNKLIYFISSGAVYSAIQNIQTGTSLDIETVKSNLSALSATVKTVETRVDTLSGATSGAVFDVSATATTGNVTTANGYISAGTTTVNSGAFAKTKRVEITLDVAETSGTVATATSSTKKLASDYAVQQYVKNLSASVVTNIETINSNISGVCGSCISYTDQQITALSGNIVSNITQNISDVYTYKGSVATVSNLPNAATYTGRSGDVYNVVAASGTPGTAGYVPAGTNYAFVPAKGSDPAHWDPLGGTVDLSAYWTSGTTNQKINTAQSTAISSAYAYTDAIVSGLNVSQYATSAALYTNITGLSATSKTYAETMKDSAITSATTWVKERYWDSATTNTKISTAVSNAITPINAVLSGKLDTVSAYSYNNYITVVNATESGTASARTQNITLSAQVLTTSGQVNSQSSTGKLVDAKAIKDYVDVKYKNASALVATEETRAKGVEEAISSRLSGLSASVQTIVSSGVSTVSFTTLNTGDAGVVGGTAAAGSHDSGVMARVKDNTLQLDLDTLVVDCGTF